MYIVEEKDLIGDIEGLPIEVVQKMVERQYEQYGICGLKVLQAHKSGGFDSKLKTEIFNPQPHYDNSKGSLYKVATERGWGPYVFDVVKRLERGGKKDPLKQEIEKSIDVLKIWLNEL